VTVKSLNDDWPSPEDLCRDPELAILALLDAAIALSLSALVATHPIIVDHERPYWIEPKPLHSDHFAQTLVHIADQLRYAIAKYRLAINAEHRSHSDNSNHPDDEIPF
jgi:hypothetical protein